MALFGYALAFVCIIIAIQLVCADDLYFADRDGRYRYVSEDVGTIPISIASRASIDREAFLYFDHYDYDSRPSVDDFVFENINFTASLLFNSTISAGDTRTFDLTIIDDNIAEDDSYIHYFYRKRINIALQVYESDGGTDYCDSYTFQIEDNDGLRFELLQTGITVEEDVGTVELCVTYGGDNVPPVIDARFHDRDYVDDIIFSGANSTFTMATGDRRCFNVTIVDDDMIKYDGVFGFEVDAVNTSLPYYYFRDYTRIIVRDNEAFRFGLERSSYSVVESDGVVSVCVTADRGDGSEIYTATLSTINITTQGEVDHGSLKQQLTCSANTGRQCFNISITDDDEVEEDELFQLTLSRVRRTTGNTYNYQLNIPTATITIIDDDLTCSPECVNGLCRHPGVCQCYEGWIDEDCSREICQPPCGENGVCNVNTGHCDCYPGFTGPSCDDDVRKCDTDNGGCDHICTDFPGGYNCSCRSGFRTDGNTCTDIDECAGDSGCNQICVNTPGSYYCNCEHGYLLVNGSQCEVLPLVVKFINDSPRVLGDSVEADILISRPVQSLICRLKAGSFITEQDCSSGHVVFSGLSPAVYTLRVVARDSHNIKAFVKNHFEIIDDPGRCTLHLINEGVSVRGDSVRVEFTGRGPASDYLCHLDRTQPYQCSSPVEVSGLSPGKHVLKVVPTGCGRNRINLKTTITIE